MREDEVVRVVIDCSEQEYRAWARAATRDGLQVEEWLHRTMNETVAALRAVEAGTASPQQERIAHGDANAILVDMAREVLPIVNETLRRPWWKLW